MPMERELQVPGSPVTRRVRGQHSQDVSSSPSISAHHGLVAFQMLGMALALAGHQAWSALGSDLYKGGNLIFQRTT